jgi:hypothetical protein
MDGLRIMCYRLWFVNLGRREWCFDESSISDNISDWHTFFLEAIASFVLSVISFKVLLSQWTGVIMCLPSQLCQISIDSDQVK